MTTTATALTRTNLSSTVCPHCDHVGDLRRLESGIIVCSCTMMTTNEKFPVHVIPEVVTAGFLVHSGPFPCEGFPE